MPNLIISPKWNPVINEIAFGELARGGPDGNINIATKQLAENIFWLKNDVATKQGEIARSVTAEADRSTQKYTEIDAKTSDLQNQVNSIGGGKFAYTTYAEMVAAANLPAGDPLKLPAKSSIDVINNIADPTKNGTYGYDGSVFTNSPYDPLTQAKAYTDTAKSAAITTAKTYADTNKLDLSRIKTLYFDGNMIGEKNRKHSGFGLSQAGVLQVRDYYNSVVLDVYEGDELYVHYQNTEPFPYGANIGFFQKPPFENQSQTIIPVVVSSYITDPTTQVMYKVFKVPTGANYMILNTKQYDSLFNWVVSKDKFIFSLETGVEKIISIQQLPIDSSETYLQAKKYTNDKLLSYEPTTTSDKNLYTGRYIKNIKIPKAGLAYGASSDIITRPIPVKDKQWYSVSGLPKSMRANARFYLRGLSVDIDTLETAAPNIDLSMDLVTIDFSVDTTDSSKFYFYIDNPAVKYIVFPLSSDLSSVKGEDLVKNLALQVELGESTTFYEPYKTTPSLSKSLKGVYQYIDFTVESRQTVVPPFLEMNKVREPDSSVMQVLAKDISPMGISYSQKTTTGVVSNNLYTKVSDTPEGVRSIYAHVMKYEDSTSKLTTLKPTAFKVPSGQYDNPNTLADHGIRNSKYGYVHPDIAYTSTPIGGFKYWMVASILPPTNDGLATWEDEDLFVSNDAKNWQRVRSRYETDKTYTTATLRLPPQSLETVSARKHAFLPVPPKGATIEMSLPADNGGAVVDRQMITLNGTATPFKHDPAIYIENGYVYIYHSFHMPYAARDGGSSRFLVCTRTSNGIDWDVVRTDGSTMRLTEETSRQIFTKDAQGRYNYMYYAYNRGYSNPTILKYGTGDYEIMYGYNYSKRFKGTTPYSFDFSTEHPIQDLGSANHPMVFIYSNKTYLINNRSVYESNNRGVNFTKLAYYPCWVGGVSSYGYKKSVCIGEGGKLILADVERFDQQYDAAISGINYSSTMRENLLFMYEYPSVSDFIGKATNGLVDAYIDVQLCKVNTKTGARVFDFIPARGLDSTTLNVNRPLQRVAVANMEFSDGDVLYIFVTLTARNGAEIQFGGIDIV